MNAPSSSYVGPPLWSHFRNIGLAFIYLLFLAFVTSMATGRDLRATLAGVTAVAVLTSVLTVLFLAQRAVSESGLRQFGLASIFLIIVAVSIYIALLRWLLTGDRVDQQRLATAWTIAAIASVPGVFASLPFVLLLSETLIWTAVKFVRLRCVQHWLAERRRRQRTGLRE